MAKRRKMVMSNLVKNSIAAYFAAIEVHNKPNISYRYETVTLLIINAWELLLKAYIRKYIKRKSIFEDENYTISFSKAISYVNEDVNTSKPRSFIAIKENLYMIEVYRNKSAHFYNEALEPQIFMLVARAALNYVEFIKRYFNKDIISDEGLFIMPLGFKLPFKPENFLSQKAVDSVYSTESKKFIESVLKVIESLKEQGIEESIVLGFDIYLESVKKPLNSDLLVAITGKNEADATFAKTTTIRLSDDPSVQVYSLSDEQFREIFPFTYRELVDWGRENIDGFIQGNLFNEIMRGIKEDDTCAAKRHLDSRSSRSASQYFYSEKALIKIRDEYEAKSEKSI